MTASRKAWAVLASKTAISGPGSTQQEQRKVVRRPAAGTVPSNAFCGLCRASGLPVPEPEWRFHPTRRWRFDYGWPKYLIALEVDGGLFNGGGHVRGAHILTTHEKMNEAARLGWRILYTTPKGLPAMLPLLKLVLTPA